MFTVGLVTAYSFLIETVLNGRNVSFNFLLIF